MKLRSMEEKISYRLFLMGFFGLLFTAALCIFVFHKAFTAQAWTGLEREAELVSAGYDLVQDPQQLTSFVSNDLRITLISQDGSVLFESATDQPMENHLSRPEIGRLWPAASAVISGTRKPWDMRPTIMQCCCRTARSCALHRTPKRCGLSTIPPFPPSC
ncbi:hypothetical protein ACKXF7_12380 [Faecalibacterium sp. 7]|uniref:hypothetical protein n=1 Tax=Faecalibacterium sp. 7 TaxID=3402017 RepID=UPI003C2EE979